MTAGSISQPAFLVERYGNGCHGLLRQAQDARTEEWAPLQFALASADQVLALTPDFSAIPDAKLGVLGAHPEGSEHEYEIRAFVPGVGVAEDPVTGSLNASVAQWLIGENLAPNSYTAAQGTALGRSGVVSITAEDDEIWVGGATSVCIRGTVHT